MKWLLFFLLSFLFGVLVGDIWFRAGIWIVSLVMMICFTLWWRIFFVACIGCFLGYTLAFASLVYFHEERERIGALVSWDGHQRTVRGIAGALVSASEFSHTYRVTVLEVDKKTVEPFDIALILPPNLSLTEGDKIVALGKFSFPRDTENYMAEKQLWNARMVAEFHTFHIDKTPPEKYNLFVRMRIWFDERLSDIFPPDGHDVLSGIILGQKNALSPELKTSLKASWLMHIMVVSGSNVMMLIIFLSLFLRSLLPWIRIAVICVSIFGFVILVGGDVPVWRAALMGVIGYSASLWWYRFSPLILPLFVASLLALANPLSIAYDIGLQLSFLSVICIISFGKSLTRFFSFLWPFFDEAMSLTVAATIGTFPITLFYFGTFSLVWPIANLFAAPAIPVLMYGGILTLLLSAFSSTLAYIAWYIPWIAVTYLLKVITFFWNHRWSLVTLEIGEYREEFMIITLSLLCLALVQSSHKRSKNPQIHQ